MDWKKALIIVDVQNDFVPGGALAVKEGNNIVPVINALQKKYDLIVATQDWHPSNHKSFASNHPGQNIGEVIFLGNAQQVLWPDHCIEGTTGANFFEKLNLSRVKKIFKKGTNPEIDSYSGFFDNDQKSQTGLGDYLKAEGVRDVTIVGLATDYCVKFTAMDAIKMGFNVTVNLKGCRGVELNQGDIATAINEMRNSGVKIIN